MKKWLLFVLFLSLISTQSFAESLTPTSPAQGSTIYIPSGQTTMDVQVCWTYETDSSGVWFSLYTDAGNFIDISSCYTVHNVSAGSKNWKLRMNYQYSGYAETFWQFNVVLTTANIKADNNFTDNSGNGTHGTMVIDGTTRTIPSNGYAIAKVFGQNLTLQAVSPQTNSQGYQMTWHTGATNPSEWTRNGSHIYDNQTCSFNVTQADHNSTYLAKLKKNYNVTFRSYLVGVGYNHGTITVNGDGYTSPTPAFPVVEQNSISATYENYFWYNNIFYIRTGDPTVVLNPNNHYTYTRNYHGYPEWPDATPRNLVVGKTIIGGESFIRLSWNEHPNSNVTRYDIWRRVVGGPSATKIASVNRGTTSYIDYTYHWQPSGTGTELIYNVVAYYSTEQSYSNSTSWYVGVWGELAPPQEKMVGNNIDSKSVAVTEYSLKNFPDPFNPSTNIHFTLPEDRFVKINIYNIVGEKVRELTNQFYSSGAYTIEWDGKDNSGNMVNSGVYIATLQARQKFLSKKIVLAK